MSLYDIEVETLSGEVTTFGALAKGKAALVVNVASKCGYTPQYEGLQRLYEEYAERGFTIVGVPSNQFKQQEPGSAEEIQQFCSATYGVTFPMLAKTDVNGTGRHPLYAELTKFPALDDRGLDVAWNFEKFLVSPEGEVVGRFRTTVTPEDAELRSAIEDALPS